MTRTTNHRKRLTRIARRNGVAVQHVQNWAGLADRLARHHGTPSACKALLTTTAGGVAPIFVGLWGAVDLIRDPYSDAQSGGLRITGLTTADVTVARPAQLEVLTGLQVGS